MEPPVEIALILEMDEIRLYASSLQYGVGRDGARYDDMSDLKVYQVLPIDHRSQRKV